MRRLNWIWVGLSFLVFASAGALAQDTNGGRNAIAFENRTCGDIQLEATGNNACFGYGGCSLDIPKRGTERVRLRAGVQPRWAQVRVNGQCDAPAPTVIKGECAVDLSDLFRAPGGVRTPRPDEAMPTDGLARDPFFERLTGPLDPGLTFAHVSIDLGMCETGEDGKDLCGVQCNVR